MAKRESQYQNFIEAYNRYFDNKDALPDQTSYFEFFKKRAGTIKKLTETYQLWILYKKETK